MFRASIIESLGLGCTLIAAAAMATPIDYSPPPGCPPPAALRGAMIEAGAPAEPPDDAPAVAITVSDDHRTAEVRLVSSGGEVLGERVVRSPTGDCDALIRAAGLSAGLALSPLGLGLAAPPPDEPPAPPEPPVVDAPEPPVAELGSGWAASAGLGAGLGRHPGAAAALWGGVRYATGPWSGRLELQLSGAPAWIDGEVGGARLSGGAAVLAGWACGGVGAWHGCLGAMGGLAIHASDGLVQDGTSTTPWGAAAASVGWMGLGGEALRFGPQLELVAPLTRLSLTVDGQSIWQAPPVAGLVGVAGWL